MCFKLNILWVWNLVYFNINEEHKYIVGIWEEKKEYLELKWRELEDGEKNYINTWCSSLLHKQLPASQEEISFTVIVLLQIGL